MAVAKEGKAAHWRNIPAASGAVLATLLATGGDGVADQLSSASSGAPEYWIVLTRERPEPQRAFYPRAQSSPLESRSAHHAKLPAIPLPFSQEISASPTGNLRKKTVPSDPRGPVSNRSRVAIAPPMASIQSSSELAAEAKILRPQFEPSTELAIAEPGSGSPSAGVVAEGAAESPAYVSQISDSIRAAYIAQVDLHGAEQRLALRSGDVVLGKVEFQVAGSDLSVNIGQVLDLFEGKMDAAHFAQLRTSPSAGEFVSLDRLRGAGIPIEYNPAYDELVLGPEGATAAT